MLEIRLKRKAKKLYKEIYKNNGILNVRKGYSKAANELASHGLIDGINLSYKGYYMTMVLTRKGWEYYKSNPSLRKPIDWKYWIGILLPIIITLIGKLFFKVIYYIYIK